MSDEIIVLTSFRNPNEAHMARIALEEAGINCAVADQNVSGLHAIYSDTAGGIKLMVRRSDAQAATEALRKRLAELPPSVHVEGLPPCPECGSRDVDRKRLSLWILLLSMMWLGLPFFFLRPRWRCNGCGNEWLVR